MKEDEFSDGFYYLKPLNIPYQFKITHNLVNLLLDKYTNNLSVKEHPIITINQQLLIDEIKNHYRLEEKFQIINIEYEKKEQRLINFTNFNINKLEGEYQNLNLNLIDINNEVILTAIEKKSLLELIEAIKINSEIMKNDIKIFTRRINLIIKLWGQISKELLVKLRNFQHRGYKLLSNNLRLKLKPLINEIKIDLKSQFNENAISRVKLENQFLSMIELAKEDIFGDLTAEQINLYNQLELKMDNHYVINLLQNEDEKNDFIELIKTSKIKINIDKLVDHLY